jgi:Fe-S-cluster containining protein
MQDLMDRIKGIFGAMEAQYGSVASHYAFGCEGCEENCCTQRFFHHTYAEFYYLLEGMKRADPELVYRITTKARVVVGAYQKELEMGELLPLMCPVNFEGRCALYEHRPMICRAHGLPHAFRMPDGAEQAGGGCGRFEALHGAGATGPRVDRTLLYTELAMVERDLRVRLGQRGRFRKTTAEMVMDMLDHLDLGEEEG